MKVFTSMVGDLFHIGHLRIIEKASDLGTLIVGIPTSDSNIIMKGHPTIVSFEQRLRIIQSIKGVHLCLGYHSKNELEKLISLIKPDIVCRGDDEKDFVGKDVAEKLGAKIIYFPYSKEISSTKIRRL
ncbi:MAG: adenylyltransferase/cytidyltransferase family protein [Candidatus Heimdallarchaeaceae archaeon]